MIFFAINPAGKMERLDILRSQFKELLAKGYRKPTLQERMEYAKSEQERMAAFEPSPDMVDVYFMAPNKRVHDGYGATSQVLIDRLKGYGIHANRHYNGQRIGIVYNYPYNLETLKCEYKILFTMFESTRMPDDWGKYLRMADKIIVPSTFCQRVLKHQFGIEAVVVPLGYDETAFAPMERQRGKNDPFTLLHYDAFKFRKGWDIVLTAYDQEFGKEENVRLIFKTTVDKLPAVALEEYHNVSVIHRILTPDELQDLLGQADCFVFPSRGEGFGITPLEAMATGMPAIVPNAHGIAEYYDWQHMQPLEVSMIKAKYSNEHFEGMDLGSWYQVSVASLRKAMRAEFEKWKNDPKPKDNPYCEIASRFTLGKTAEKLSVIVKDAMKSLGKSKENSLVFISENLPYVSGGRYYSWFCATALKALGFDVVVYTNDLPPFLDEFKDFPTPTVYLMKDLTKLDVKAAAYFGSPVRGSERAAELAIKYGKKAYVEVFDPFPIMAKYRGKDQYPEWEKLLDLMRKNDNVEITSLCHFNNDVIYWWLNKRRDQVHTVYPCINNIARDKSPATMPKKNWVTFVSRLDNHKKLDHVLRAVKATDCELHVITGIDGINFETLVKEEGMQDRVVIHWKVDDREKFEIIKQSRATINGAVFEGFGMWLPESLSCGVPVVCYEYPIFREIVGDRPGVYFADWGKEESLKEKLQEALRDNPTLLPVDSFDFPAMVETFRNILLHRPKIGVVMCALNEQKFIGAALKALVRNPNITKIAVVEGCVTKNEIVANADGLSTDDTPHVVVDEMTTPQGSQKIIYDRYGWAANKSELRNRALKLLGTGMDYILVVDADEVWKQDDLDILADFMDTEKADVFWFPFHHFWKDGTMVAKGSQWEAPLFRCFKYTDKTLHWERHEAPVVNGDGVKITENGREMTAPVHVYHYGYCKDAHDVQSKIEYYRKRDTDLKVRDTWSDWKPGDPTQPTHGGGTAVPFEGTHPDEVLAIIDNK